MHKRDQFDQPVERPTYTNAQFVDLHQKGLLSRLEAEVLDIVQTGFSQFQEDASSMNETSLATEPVERSYVALIHKGDVIPFLDLEQVLQQPKTMVEQTSICIWATNVIMDVIFALLKEEQES
jgi:hypothetical protein